MMVGIAHPTFYRLRFDPDGAVFGFCRKDRQILLCAQFAHDVTDDGGERCPGAGFTGAKVEGAAVKWANEFAIFVDFAGFHRQFQVGAGVGDGVDCAFVVDEQNFLVCNFNNFAGSFGEFGCG